MIPWVQLPPLCLEVHGECWMFFMMSTGSLGRLHGNFPRFFILHSCLKGRCKVLWYFCDSDFTFWIEPFQFDSRRIVQTGSARRSWNQFKILSILWLVTSISNARCRRCRYGSKHLGFSAELKKYRVRQCTEWFKVIYWFYLGQNCHSLLALIQLLRNFAIASLASKLCFYFSRSSWQKWHFDINQ